MAKANGTVSAPPYEYKSHVLPTLSFITPHSLTLFYHSELNLFTGWKDPALTEKGRGEAKAGAERLQKHGYQFDLAYTSDLTRAQTTLAIILDILGQPDIEIHKDQALNERDYGELTGLNKDDARKKWGEEQVHIWRRSYDVPPPKGESLEMTAQRTLPYYHAQIKPKVLSGKKVLVAAHGNSLRYVQNIRRMRHAAHHEDSSSSIIMELEGLSGEEIVKKELDTGVPIVYELDAQGVSILLAGRAFSQKDLKQLCFDRQSNQVDGSECLRIRIIE